MPRYGPQSGPDRAFLGVERCDWSDPASYDGVEVPPPFDHAETTSFVADRVVLEALSGIARRTRDAVDGTTWDPSLPLLAQRTPPPQEQQ